MTVKLTEFMGYLNLEAGVEEAIKILELIQRKYGRDTEDVRDSLRILRNFDTFYDITRRKFKDYITPRKSEAELLRGNVVVDKIKLIKSERGNRVVIVFDKRVDRDTVLSVLRDLGLEEG